MLRCVAVIYNFKLNDHICAHASERLDPNESSGIERRGTRVGKGEVVGGRRQLGR